MLFNLDREDEIWQHVSEFNVTSSKENGHIGDQRLMDMVNISFPEKVALLPDEWYVTLSRLKNRWSPAKGASRWSRNDALERKSGNHRK